MKTFILVRDEDVSGVSGTGAVAEGVVFSTGKCAMAWLTKYRSVAIYDSVTELEAIHSHEGKTRLLYVGDDIPDPRTGA